MKRKDMDRSLLTAVNSTLVTAAICALVPSSMAQIANLDPAPPNVFQTERAESLADFLNVGPISIRPHLNTTVYYDDNLAIKNSPQFEDLVWRISPGALLGIGEFRGDTGNFATIDYTATGGIYTKYSEFNALDHLVAFDAGWKFSKLALGVGQSYEISNGKQIETSGFVEQESYITTLTSKYDLSEKTSFELNGRQMLIDSTERVIDGPDRQLNTINQWELEGWGDYKLTEKVSVGGGVIFGWRDIRAYANGAAAAPSSPNQTFQQVAVRSSYELSEKVDLHGSIGLFFSQFQDAGSESPTLVFNLGASWQPLQNTFVSAEAYRRDYPSYSMSGQNYIATGFRTEVRQLFRDKYSAAIATGYENSDYSDPAGATSGDRRDGYFWIRPTANYEINERFNAGVFYQFRTKNSNMDALDYSNNQVGVYSNYRF